MAKCFAIRSRLVHFARRERSKLAMRSPIRTWLLIAAFFCCCTASEERLPEHPPSTRVGKATAYDLAGCYAVDMGRWNPPMPGTDASPFNPPAEIRLTLDPLRRPPSRGPGREAPVFIISSNMGNQIHTYRAWRMPDPTRIELTWSTGYAGLNATIDVRSNIKLLTGSATAFPALHSKPSAAPVRLRRSTC